MCGSRHIHTSSKEGHVLEIPVGRGWGPFQKPKFLIKGKYIYEAKLKFPEGWRGPNQKTFCRGGAGWGYEYFMEQHTLV